MKTTLSSEIIANIAEVINQMGDKDFMEIPDSDGLVLVKMGSEACKEREEDHSIMFYEFNDTFCVTSK